MVRDLRFTLIMDYKAKSSDSGYVVIKVTKG
jgi:hypothetical protein